MSWGCTCAVDWLNSALSPVVYGDIALSINTQYNVHKVKPIIEVIIFTSTILSIKKSMIVKKCLSTVLSICLWHVIVHVWHTG